MQKILVIDDDTVILEVLENYLAREGFAVLVAETGRTGIKLFDEYTPELVLTDLAMPDPDGLAVLRHVKTRRPETLAIIMTGQGDEHTALQVLGLGGTDYFTKPLNLKALGTTLHHYASVLKDSLTDMTIVPFLEEEILKLVVPNTLKSISATVACLVQRASTVFGPEDIACIRLGLDEMLLNACQHGNLRITPQEKSTAIDQHRLDELFEQRATCPEYIGRRIHVDFHLTRHEMICHIKDDGPGFNWQSTPVTLSLDTLWDDGGRGVPLTAMQFDAIKFNEKGNAVTLIKRRKLPA